MNRKPTLIVTVFALFRRPTVATIVADMERQVTRLMKLADQKIAAAEKRRKKANEILSQARDDEHEADRALRVAERFTDLIA